MDDFDLVQKIVGFIEEASPMLWDIAQRQVYVSAITASFWAAILFAVTAVCGYTGKWAFRQNVEENEKVQESRSKRRNSWDYYYKNTNFEMLGWTAGVLGAAMGIFAAILLTYAVQYILNPQYYAIDKLLALIPGV